MKILSAAYLFSSDSYICDTNAITHCTDGCPITYNPYCGTDGKSYKNRCELARAWCRSGGKVKVDYCGFCSKFLILLSC